VLYMITQLNNVDYAWWWLYFRLRGHVVCLCL